MPSRLPQFRVPFVDLRNALVTKEWFRFFQDLFNLTGAGGNTLSLTDLSVGGVAPISDPPFAAFTVINCVTANLNFPNTAAGACSNLNITVPGCVLSDMVILGAQVTSLPANGAFTAYAGNGIVTIRYTNNDPAVAYDPAAGFFRVMVLRALP